MFRWLFNIRKAWAQLKAEWNTPTVSSKDPALYSEMRPGETLVELEPGPFVELVRRNRPSTIYSQFTREDDSAKCGYVWFMTDDHVKTRTWGEHYNWDSAGILQELGDLYQQNPLTEFCFDKEHATHTYSLMTLEE